MCADTGSTFHCDHVGNNMLFITYICGADAYYRKADE